MICGEAMELISRRLDGLLDEQDSAPLEAHLAECDRCVLESSKMVAADRLLRGRPAPDPASDLADRVLRRDARDRRLSALGQFGAAAAATLFVLLGVWTALPGELKPEPPGEELERHFAIIAPYAEVAPVTARDPQKATAVLREEARILGLDRRTAALKHATSRSAPPAVQKYLAASEGYVRGLDEGPRQSLANALAGAQELEKEVAQLRQTMNMSPAPPQVDITFPSSTPQDLQQVVRGRMEYVQGQYGRAVESFQRVSKQSAFASQSAYHTAEALRKMGDTEQALNYYCEVLESKELKERAARSLVSLAKDGELYVSGRRVEQAKDAIEAYDQKSPVALFRQGRKSDWVYLAPAQERTFKKLSSLAEHGKGVLVRTYGELSTARINSVALREKLTQAELDNLMTYEPLSRVLKVDSEPAPH